MIEFLKQKAHPNGCTKMKIQHICLVLAVILFGSDIVAQVPRKVLVEHFTNTRCGICGSKNPGLYDNLNQHPDILHLAYHPSRPYASCVLNQSNPAENDDRTKFYGIFGGTPRVVVQGQVRSSGADFKDASIFSGEQGQQTPIAVRVTQGASTDSLRGTIYIRTAAENDLKDLNLFIVAVEDTIFYDAPNGEKEHKDVFRKVLYDEKLILGQNGDSVTVSVASGFSNEWNKDRMYIMALVQHSDKYIEQVGRSKMVTGDILSAQELLHQEVFLYPNPTSGRISIKGLTGPAALRLYDLQGKVVFESQYFGHEHLDLGNVHSGIYFLRVNQSESTFVRPVRIIHR